MSTIQFNSDIAEGNDEVRIAFYANIGFFIEIAQMLEFNLRKLLCYELSVKEIKASHITKDDVSKICSHYDDYYKDTYEERWTLGKLKKEVEKVTSLPPDFVKIIEDINNYRIALVHKAFQNNIMTGVLADPDNVRSYIDTRLIPMTNKAIETNKKLIKIIEPFRSDLCAYKTKVGIL